MNGKPESWRPSIVIYSHDGFGLGHLSRTVYVAQCLRDRRPDIDILILTSSAAAHRFSGLDNFEYVKLPSVTKIGVEQYHPHNLRTSLESIITLRSSLLLTVLKSLKPDLFLVDHRPLGLKQEVRPALEWIRNDAPEIRTIVGLRDVVDDAATVREQWCAQGIYEALDRYYDHILVYGDRQILDPIEEYGIPERVARKVRFTGYLSRSHTHLSRQRVREMLGLRGERLIVVHAGGGGDGAALIGTYLDCIDALPDDIYTLAVTGPLMDRVERARLFGKPRPPRLRLVDYQDDLLSYVAAADLTVCMGGYNSVAEILSVGARALIIPRVYPRAEQYIRAHLLQKRGLLQAIDPGDLDARSLAQHITTALAEPPRRAHPVRLDGGPRVADFLTSLLSEEGWGRMAPAEMEIGARS